MTEDECVAEARQWNRADLLRILRTLEDGGTRAGWPAGKDFEYAVIRAFELEGLEVRYPFRVAMHDVAKTTEQIDGSVLSDGVRFLVESKAWERDVTRGPIALLSSQLARRPPATMGMVFTMRGYTPAAVALTNMTSPIRLLLWFPDELRVAVEAGLVTAALAFKYRWAQERGTVDGHWSPEVAP